MAERTQHVTALTKKAAFAVYRPIIMIPLGQGMLLDDKLATNIKPMNWKEPSVMGEHRVLASWLCDKFANPKKT